MRDLKLYIIKGCWFALALLTGIMIRNEFLLHPQRAYTVIILCEANVKQKVRTLRIYDWSPTSLLTELI